ncbi:MAG: hypothetical protein LQ340_008035, partial [Diploschistes diacapsis]
MAQPQPYPTDRLNLRHPLPPALPSQLSSALSHNQSLYHDFPYVHAHAGSTAFLSWHRYFLHAYETALRSRCACAGHLPYWDWTLDWADLGASPVFSASPTSGFGTDGDPEATGGNVMVNEGHCVTDGAFAGLVLPYVGREYAPQCLSRGFVEAESRAYEDVTAGHVRPEAVDRVTASGSYAEFWFGLEGPHLGIPYGIRGDFLRLTATNGGFVGFLCPCAISTACCLSFLFDPIFILHHTNVDRLWWTWQRMAPAEHLLDYAGPAAGGSAIEASLDDRLEMGGLAPAVR